MWSLDSGRPQLARLPLPRVTSHKSRLSCAARSPQVCFPAPNAHRAHGHPSRHHRPPHRRAARAARRKFHHRHQRRENRQGNRRLAPAGVAMDAKAARARRSRAKAIPAPAITSNACPTFSRRKLLSSRLHGTAFARRIHHFFKIDSTNYSRHAARRSRRTPRRNRCRRRTNRRTRPRRPQMGLGKIRRHLLHAFCCGRPFPPRTPRFSRSSPASPHTTQRRKNLDTRARHSLAERSARRRTKILRHTHRNARRARPRPLRRRRHRHQRESERRCPPNSPTSPLLCASRRASPIRGSSS